VLGQTAGIGCPDWAAENAKLARGSTYEWRPNKPIKWDEHLARAPIGRGLEARSAIYQCFAVLPGLRYGNDFE
jgi:hypothetical protein